MRYGVLADIHANLPALRAVVDALKRRGVDRWLVAGDLVGYGPHPNECVELVAALEADVVAGNHDLIALGRLPDTRCIPLARDSLRWTRDTLGDDARAFLAGLPVSRVAEGGVLLAHGSPTDPQHYVASERQAQSELAKLDDRPEIGVVVLGHTHRPLAVAAGSAAIPPKGDVGLPAGRRVLLNAGAVGQSREFRALARGMVLDLDAGEATFVRLAYDIERARADLRAAGLSERGCHLRPRARGAARRVVSAVRRP